MTHRGPFQPLLFCDSVILPRLSFTPDIMYLLIPSGAGGQGMVVVVISSHVVSAVLSSSGGGLHTLFPCSRVRSLSQETVPHKLLQRESFPMGCSPSGTDFSNLDLPLAHRFCQQTCPSVAFSFHGFTGPGRSLLQRGLPMGSQSPSGASTCSSLEFSMDCRSVSFPPWTSMDCKGTACLTMVFTTGCRGISAPVSGTALLPYSLSSLCCCCSTVLFFPLFIYVVTEALPLLLMGSALASGESVLEPTGFTGHRGSF